LGGKKFDYIHEEYSANNIELLNHKKATVDFLYQQISLIKHHGQTHTKLFKEYNDEKVEQIYKDSKIAAASIPLSLNAQSLKKIRDSELIKLFKKD